MHVHFTFKVPKSADLEKLIDRSVKKLNHLLVVFQPELVQLHGRFDRHTAREGTVCSLNLRLPTGQLAAEEAADTAQTALRSALSDLVDQVKRHKAKLREDQNRPRKVRESGMIAEAPAGSSEHGEPAVRQRREDLSRYVSAQVDRLQEFVERQIRLRERLGEITPGQLDVREVLDELIASALAEADMPENFERERWLYVLAIGAIRKLAADGSDGLDAGSTVSLDRDVRNEEMRSAEQFEYLEPEEVDDVRVRDITPDLSVATPEDIAYTDEALSLLDAALQRLPAQQREDLVLFALEGFSLHELALISQRSPEDVRREIAQAQKALQGENDIPVELRRMLVDRTRRRLSEVA
jgi:DNA-directed RNA polymerase specialized sigma24 family protein/ribosome-associated translation inhibitor RaiA